MAFSLLGLPLAFVLAFVLAFLLAFLAHEADLHGRRLLRVARDGVPRGEHSLHLLPHQLPTAEAGGVKNQVRLQLGVAEASLHDGYLQLVADLVAALLLVPGHLVLAKSAIDASRFVAAKWKPISS